MQSSNVSLGELSKNLENELNRKFYSAINSLAFISAVGDALEVHLDQIVASREQFEQWRCCMDLPTRDNIAEIAIRMIAIEGRLDRLDEELFQTELTLKKMRSQLASLRSELVE